MDSGAIVICRVDTERVLPLLRNPMEKKGQQHNGWFLSVLRKLIR